MSLIYTENETRTESAIITSQPGILSGLIVACDGTNNQTIALYDGTDTTGRKITPSMVFIGSSRVQAISLDIQYQKGLYVYVSGSGGREYTVYFKSH